MVSGIPTRESNPFATCWLGPLGTSYVATDGNAPSQLASKLASQGWRGQIVGPHGVGKSTLLRALEREATRLGWRWVEVALHSDRKPSLARLLPTRLDQSALLVVDGFEQLHTLERLLVRWHCWRSGAGLLVTTHRPFRLPTLLEISPDEPSAVAVFEQVTSGADTQVTKHDALVAFNACNRDMRQMFDRLYDLHEHRKRTADVANKRRDFRVSKCEQTAT
ncbi:hypothetical protein [Aeoliella sp.]|uniref:hypothetical protein n=1 Tax=Aeoliella sp. TaxID=2795800 RepID=UPI003CCB9FC7